MRRVFAVVSLAVVSMIGAGCRHDGRTLRPPPDDRRSSISTPPKSTEVADDPAFDDGGGDGDGGVGSAIADAPTIVAPWISGDEIPAAYTCDGANGSPPLSWGDAPEGTVEVAITVTDDDAPNYVHWALAGLDRATTSIAEKTVPAGAVQALNGSNKRGYSGPCPPPGVTHTYRYTVHFLDQQVELGDDTPGPTMLAGINAVTIDYAETVGTYTRVGAVAAVDSATDQTG